jgi:hypothetical protein
MGGPSVWRFGREVTTLTVKSSCYEMLERTFVVIHGDNIKVGLTREVVRV